MRRFVHAVGCFDCKAFKVSSLLGAGVSSEHKKRTAALKLPASSLLEMAAASLDSCIKRHSDFLTGGGLGGEGCFPLQAPILLLTILARFLVAPPLSGTASTAAPNDNSELHAVKSLASLEIFINRLARVVAHCTRAALRTLVMSLIHCGVDDQPLGGTWGMLDGGFSAIYMWAADQRRNSWEVSSSSHRWMIGWIPSGYWLRARIDWLLIGAWARLVA